MLQIHLDDIQDANNDPDQFVPTKKMISHGPGAILVGPFRFPESVQTPWGGTVVALPFADRGQGWIGFGDRSDFNAAHLGKSWGSVQDDLDRNAVLNAF